MVKIMKQNRLTLDDVEWGVFKVTDYFEVKDGYYNKKPKRTHRNETLPFLGATAYNNGITEFYDENVINQWDKVGNKTSSSYNKRYFDGRCIAIVNNGSVGKVYYQNHKFTCSHDITPIYGKDVKITRNIGLFLVKCFEKTGETYSYSRKWRPKRIRKSKILLPMNENNEPNWKFMEDYIKQEQKDIAYKVISYYEKKMLETSFDLVGFGDVEWRNFKVGDLFDFDRKPSKGLNNLEIATDNGISYLGATNRNNGVLEFVEPRKDLIYKGDCIAFIRNGEGSMGYSIYKKEDFIATQDISVGYNINLNQYNGMFITTIADRVRGKYNFGYKRNQIRLENEILTLPADKNGNPHWEYMSEFMKKLEVENLEKVLEYIYIYI